jgi:D-alanine transaminase
MMPPRTLANLNGEIMPLEEVRIPALDRGFLFGDAVYEVLRICRGRPWLFEPHWRRFARSLQEIRITGVDLDRLRRRMEETIAAGQFGEALVYLQVTRGSAPRRHAFPAASTPLEFLFVQDFADHYADQRRQGVAVITQPDLRWQRCDIKSTNLLGNVLAIQAATEAGCNEALLYTPDGNMTEATHSSFFAVIDKTLVATPQSPAILPGITRGFLIELAKSVGVPFREQVLSRRELMEVSELFLSGTGSEVLAIVKVDGKSIADGRPGPVTLKLLDAYQAEVARFLAESAAARPNL